MAGSTVNLVTADGTTHLNGLEVLNNAQVDGNLIVLGTISGEIDVLETDFVTPITTVGNGTITALAISGGYVIRTGPVAAFSDATDTAAAILALFPGSQVGSTFTFNLKNATAFMETITAGTGVTLPPTVLIPPFSETNYLVTFTNVTTGSVALSLTHINTNAIISAPSIVSPYASSLSTGGTTGTILAAMFVGGLISRTAASGNYTDTTDTAVAIIAAMPSLVNKIGTGVLVEIANQTNFVQTITGGVGVTVSGVTVIPPNTISQFLITYTAAATLTMVGLGVTQGVSTALNIAGSTSGFVTLQSAAIAGANTASFPALTDTLALGLGGSNAAALNIVSTTTLATVSGLSVALQAAGVYKIDATIPVSGVTVSNGIKVALAATNSLSVTSMTVNGWVYSGTTLETVTNAAALGTDIGSANTCTLLKIDGSITVNAAGTLNLQAAQHTSTSLTTTIGAGGVMYLSRIS